MTTKNGLLVSFAAILALVYAVWFTDWFRPPTVKIFHAHRAVGRARNATAPALIFGVNRPVRLTELKVVPVAALQTNKNPLPLWHLVSDSNSLPLKTFTYGQSIGGMRPALKGVRAEPLVTNVVYRMFLTAGKIRGEHDFELE